MIVDCLGTKVAFAVWQFFVCCIADSQTDAGRQTSAAQQRLACSFFHCLPTTNHLIGRGEGVFVGRECALPDYAAVLRLELELDGDTRGEGVRLAEAHRLPVPVRQGHLVQAPLVPEIRGGETEPK